MQLDIKEVVYSFFMCFDDEGRAWILTIVCKEKKKRKFDILMKYSIK